MHLLKTIITPTFHTTPMELEALTLLIETNPFPFIGAENKTLYNHLRKLSYKGLAERKGYKWYPTKHGLLHWSNTKEKKDKKTREQTTLQDFTPNGTSLFRKPKQTTIQG